MKHFKPIFFLGMIIATVHANNVVIDSIKTVVKNAIWQTTVTKYYDPSYTSIPYPNGDVAIECGVCCDVIVRAYRSVGIDFQEMIHQDMGSAFGSYPKNWSLKRPDPNIDHRRVPNIMTFLSRNKKMLPITDNGNDYKPGDIVSWKIPGNLDHIGIVTNIPIKNTNRFGVVHNIGDGAKLEDVLFSFKITGHYRYFKTR